MNRSSILCHALPAISVLLITAAACGPRMKPVEYEEPPKDLSSSSSGGEADDSSSSSSSSSASSSAAPSSSSESSSGEAPSKFVGACKEKKCGDTCTECAPGDATCMEILVLKQCNLKGECVPAPAECSAPKKDKDKGKDKDKAK